MKKLLVSYAIVLVAIVGIVSCGDSNDEPAPPALEITTITATSGDVSRTGVVDAAAQTVVFQPFAPRTDLTSVVIEVTLPEGVTVSPASGVAQDFSSGPVTYTISNGVEELAFEVTVTAEFAASIAFVGDANASGSITEPDMAAAFAFLSTEFGEDLEYIPFSSVNADALQYIEVVVYYQDTDKGNNPGMLEAIPVSAQAQSVVDAFKEWHANGGDFVLAGHATQYLNQLGRIPADGDKSYADNGWAPRIFGSGDGFDNPDQWGINVNLNVNSIETVSTTDWDRSSHPILEGATFSDVANPAEGTTYDHPIVPLIAAGYKEDHNSMWDINAAPITDHVDAFDKADKWEAAMEATIIGTWGHVVDLCCGAVVELHPRAAAAGEGAIIVIGPAAYEWEQDGSANAFVDNNASLTVNSINYLMSK
ncbi:DUF4960 domain-containing protein [Marinoscillum furvescens]|uniref:Uncharacterized protein DUF4960 n=1 Tax=Marinoscillum furvescens DSM 4134 TaxID=1122208 RepID=A0A3D9LFX9_MARFU|nr:DUF4960 domain-containing protein [Marinoscillum furvescens]REE05538.1 uncharacterized protein DUF4960 [Marinoscillum furvescens DSM 4134]